MRPRVPGDENVVQHRAGDDAGADTRRRIRSCVGCVRAHERPFDLDREVGGKPEPDSAEPAEPAFDPGRFIEGLAVQAGTELQQVSPLLGLDRRPEQREQN